MSWIVAVAAISLAAGCAADPEVSCGDDIIEAGGLDVSFEGREPGAAYDFAIDAEGASLVVSAPPGQPTDLVTADLGGGRTLGAQMADSSGSFLHIKVLLPASDLGWVSETGPASVTVAARTGGVEVGRATFTPTYTRDVPWDPACPFYDGAAATLQLTEAP